MDADRLKALLDYVSDGVCLVDREQRIVYWNHGAEKITGFLAQEVAGKTAQAQLGAGADLTHSSVKPNDALKPIDCEEFIRHRHGHRVPVHMRRHAMVDADGSITGVAQVFTRATADGRPELSQAARHSGHDALTGAVNREYGELRVIQELEVSQRFGLSTAWMRVGIRKAEALERNFGRGMADATMQMIAHTIDANLNPLDCLIRWDAHSFRVMLRHAVEAHVAELASRLLRLVGSSRVAWWGEARSVDVDIASVMAVPEDNIDSLEQRVKQTMEGQHKD